MVVAALVLSGCTSNPDTPQALDGWHQIMLPDGMLPSSLLVTDDAVLVGGHREAGTDRSPALVSMLIDGPDVDPAEIRLRPTTPYGKVADLVSLTGDGSLVALGAAHGGAHANFRWTIWTGTTTRLIDRPQTFETFGGWEAGTLLGVASDGRGPLVVGTWQGTYGPEGAVWRAEGERWVRQPTPATLANSRQRQVAPRTVDRQGDGSVVVNGSVIDLTDGVHQSAAYWRDTDGDWTLTVLEDPGRRSEAWSTACSGTCWSVGSRDGSAAIWSNGIRVTIPTLSANDTDTGRALLWHDQVVIAFTSNGSGRLLIGQSGTWRLYSAPDGQLRAAALVGTRLHLVLGSTEATALVVRDLSDVLER